MITISDNYRLQQQKLHSNPNYGIASVSFAPFVADVIRRLGTRSVSDYGAGKKRLLKALIAEGIPNIDYFPYDPAFPEYGPPRAADLVCCIDVLEHIEPEFLNSVLDELRAIISDIGFLTVSCVPAQKNLEDGRNAHLIQKPVSWWRPLLEDRFSVFKTIELKRAEIVTGAIFLVENSGKHNHGSWSVRRD